MSHRICVKKGQSVQNLAQFFAVIYYGMHCTDLQLTRMVSAVDPFGLRVKVPKFHRIFPIYINILPFTPYNDFLNIWAPSFRKLILLNTPPPPSKKRWKWFVIFFYQELNQKISIYYNIVSLQYRPESNGYILHKKWV